MKKLLLSTVFAMGLSGSVLAQLSFFTANGTKQIEMANTSMTDLMVKFPVPEKAMNHEFVRFYVLVSPNYKSETNNTYYVDLKKDFLKGKKEVKLWLRDAKGGSDFRFSEIAPTMNIFWPATDKDRVDQVWKLTFWTQGMDIAKYEYETNNLGQVIKTPVYTITYLDTYYDIFPFDYGKVNADYVSGNKLFSVKKIYSSKKEVEIDDANLQFIVKKEAKKDNDVYNNQIDLGALIPQDGNVEAENASLQRLIITASGSKGQLLKTQISSFDASSMNVSDVQKDIIEFLRFTANEKNSGVHKNLNGYMVDWSTYLGTCMEFFIPSYGIKLAKKGDNKAVLDKYSSEPQWSGTTVGGLSMKMIEFPAAYDNKSSSWDASDAQKRYFVKEGKMNNTRFFRIYVGEKNGKVYVISMYDYSGETGLSSEDESFFKEVVDSFKVM